VSTNVAACLQAGCKQAAGIKNPRQRGYKPGAKRLNLEN
jgi:hypothetical protein